MRDNIIEGKMCMDSKMRYVLIKRFLEKNDFEN